jgi:hypothetical protein
LGLSVSPSFLDGGVQHPLHGEFLYPNVLPLFGGPPVQGYRNSDHENPPLRHKLDRFLVWASAGFDPQPLCFVVVVEKGLGEEGYRVLFVEALEQNSAETRFSSSEPPPFLPTASLPSFLSLQRPLSNRALLHRQRCLRRSSC